MKKQAVGLVIAIAFITASFWSLERIRQTQDVARGTAASEYGDFSLDLIAPAFAQGTDNLVELPLDEGSGTVAQDVSGSLNDGTLVNGPVYEANAGDGSAFALRFDGVDDFIDLGPLDVNGSGLTLAAWFNPDGFPNDDSRLISKATGTADNDHVFMLSTRGVGSAIRLRARVRVGGSTETIVADSGDLVAGSWQHAAVTYDGTTIRLYLDGTQVDSTPLSGAVDTDPTVSVAVGAQPTGAGDDHFVGLIDDVRILQRALSAAEISAIADVNFNVVELPLDEGSGTLAVDVSGSSNDGTLVNGPAYEADTTDGSAFALRLDGADDFIDLGPLDVNGTGLTLAAWFNADGFPQGDPRLISKATGTAANDHIFMLSTVGAGPATRLQARVRVGGATTTLVAGSGDLMPDEWRHAAATYDGTTLRLYLDGAEVDDVALSGIVDIDPTVPVAVGAQPPGAGGKHFDGLIDDVRILQRALSAREISTIANAGIGLVELPLDMVNGTVAEDVSGSANNGTLVNGPVYEANTVDGSDFAVRFDGSDDFIDLGQLDVKGTGLTLAAWFNAESFPQSEDPRLISKATSTAANDHVFMLSMIEVGAATRLRARVRVGGVTTTLIATSGDLVAGSWQHAAATHDGKTLRLYLDGAQVGSDVLIGIVDTDPTVFVAVGGQPTGAGGKHFDGLIDSVRIFQRALGAHEILAIADAGVGRTAAVGETVVLDGSGSLFPGGTESTYSWQVQSNPLGSAATLSDPAAVKPRLDIDIPGQYDVDLRVGDGLSRSKASSVTISTVNSAPVADAGLDVSGADVVATDSRMALDGSKSWDPDGDPLSYQWTIVAEPIPGTVLFSDTSPRTYFDASILGPSAESGRYIIELTVSDGVASDTDRVILTANENLAPLADAGPGARGVVGSEVILDLDTTQDQEGDQVDLSWSLISRPSASTAALVAPDAARPRLAVDVPGDYVVKLDAANPDPLAALGSDTVVISTINTPPVASAGPLQTLTTGSLVELDAGASTDLDGDLLTYRWALVAKPVGSAAVLDDPDAVRPSFTADLDGLYVAQVTVRDGTEASVPDTVLVAASDLVLDTPDEPQNLDPVADAGPDQTVPLGTLAQLDGSGSFYPANIWNLTDVLTFDWSILSAPKGSAAALTDPAATSPAFTPDLPGLYVVQLAVQTEIPSVRVLDTVTISTSASRPVADAGPDQSVTTTDSNPAVQLDGSASSDADNDTLNFSWALLHRPLGSSAQISSPTSANASFTPDVTGTYVAQLIVSDAELDSRPDTVVIDVVVDNIPPVADAGPDRRVLIPNDRLVTLDGSGSSDPDSDPLGFAWSFVSTPAGSTAALTDAGTAMPSFVADLAGDYVVELIVSDGALSSAPDTVTVIADANRPVADAGPDQTVTTGTIVTLDGSASSDPEGAPLSFSWQVLFPADPNDPPLTNPTSASPTFTAPAGLTIVELTVNDGGSDSLPATVAIRAGSGVANTAPLLDPIGPRTVALGTTLVVPLTGSDPDGDDIFFRAAPMPDGAALDAVIEQVGLPNAGLFVFTPGPEQVGDVVLTFAVSDGFASDSESVTINVTGSAPGTLTAFSGRILDADEEAANPATDLPVEGATVSVGAMSTTSDPAGFFTLTGLPIDGQALLEIDASTAVAAPDGSPYASLSQAIDLIASVAKVEDRPFFLMRAPAGINVPVNPTGTTIVENSAVPGVSLQVPQGATTAAALSVSEIPAALVPASLPASIMPCQVIKILPFGTAFNPAASLTLPNLDNLPTGTSVDLWGLDPANGLFRVLGQGSVTSATVITAANLVTEATFLFAVPRAPNTVAARDENGFNRRPTVLADGNLSTSLTLPSYRSLSVDRSLTFVYNSTAADPRPIVAAEVTFPVTTPAATALPPVIESRLEVGGIEVAGPVFMDTTVSDVRNGPGDPPLAEGDTIRQAISFDASQFATGSYPVRYTATANYDCSKMSAVATGRILIDNQQDSPFGAGWSLAGLQRVTEQADGTVVLEEGDGTIKAFDPFSALVETTGDVTELVDPPGSVEVNVLEDDGDIVVFNEQRNFPLPADVLLNAVNPRIFSATIQLQNQNLPAGTFVNSYFVHFDIVSNSSILTRSGSVTFNEDILGVILLIDDLDASDVVLGRDDIIYPDPEGTVPGFPNNARGLEFTQGDRVTISPDRRTITMNYVTANSADQIRVVTVGEGDALDLVASTFDVDDEGWTVFGDANVPFHEAVDGNPDGHIGVVDQTTGVLWFFSAPAKFLGDKSRFYNGRLSFDLRQSDTTQQLDDDDVVLIGGGLTLALETPYNPLTDWTRYSTVLLRETAGWVVSGQSRPPTQAEFLAVLADLTELRIRGEFLFGPDTGRLDNVVLVRVPPATPSIAGLRAPAGDFSELEKNANGSFTRRLKDGTLISFDTEGLMTAIADRNGNTTGYGYDAQSRLDTITDPLNQVTNFDYTGDRLSSVTDPTGRVTQVQMTPAGTLASVTQPDDSVRRYAYDTNNRLIAEASERGFVTKQNLGFAGQYEGSDFPDSASITAQISKSLGLANLGLGIGSENDPAPYARPNGSANLVDGNGNPFTMRFNEFSSVVEINDPIGRQTFIDRDANNLAIRVDRPSDGELPDGSVPGRVVTELDYDERGNVAVQREAAGTTLERETRFEYEPDFNNATLIADPSNTDPAPACGNAGVTCFDYDAKGNRTKTTDALGGEQVSIYDPITGLELSRTEPNDNPGDDPTEFDYDLFGNLQIITDAEMNKTQFVRDAAGRVTARLEGFGTPEQRATSFTYDAMNRVETETDGTGAATTTRYDAAGNVVETEDATGLVVVRAYDERDRLALGDDPAQGPVSRGYDANGNLKIFTNAVSETILLEYDAANRLLKATDPLQNERQFTYDATNKLQLVTDTRQNVTRFAYDILGRQIRRTNALNEIWDFEYDSRDNITKSTDPKDQTINVVYDNLSRQTSVTLIEFDGSTVEDTITFTYDANGNRLTAQDGDSSLAFTYDTLNRVETAETLVDMGSVQPAVVLASVYDAVGNRTQLTHGPNELVVSGAWSFAHDMVGRLVGLVGPDGNPTSTVDLTYDAAGRLERIDFPNSVASRFLYDLGGRVDSITHQRGVAELTTLLYANFEDGMTSSISESDGTRIFTYDAFQQLVGGGKAAAPESYNYDEEGNRTTSHLSLAHQHDSANRLIEDDAFCYGYDANGNLNTKTAKAGGLCTGANTTYGWDVRNRLVRIDFPDATSASYRYDAVGRRIEKNLNGSITRYIYDDDDIVLEYDGNNVLLAQYSHGLDVDQPLISTRGAQNFFYHTDHLGSVLKITDTAGTVVNSYDYGSFGRFETRLEGVANPFTYTAREFDWESGLYFYRARYYDSFVGRFISQDPIGLAAGDSNLYRYAFNNPVNLLDPTGLVAFGNYGKLAAIGRQAAGCLGGLAAGAFGALGGLAGEVLSIVPRTGGDILAFSPLLPTVDEALFSFTKTAALGCVAGILGTKVLPNFTKVVDKATAEAAIDAAIVIAAPLGFFGELLFGILEGFKDAL